MAVKFPEFLLAYYEWLRLSSMPESAVARFRDIEKKENLTKDMKAWEKYMETLGAPGGGPGGIGKPTNQPDPAGFPSKDDSDVTVDIDDAAWENLYRTFQSILSEMDGNRGKLKDNKDAIAYINTVFGPGKVFSMQPIDPAVQTEITNFVAFLRTPQGASIGTTLAARVGIEDFNEFVTKLDSGAYRTDSTVRKNLIRIVSTLDYEIDYGGLAGLAPGDLKAIISGLDDRNTVVQAHKLDLFKVLYPGILKPLYTKSKIRDAVAATERGAKVLDPLNKAIENISYDNKESKNFLAPKLVDKKTPWQEFSGAVQDTLDDTILKLKNRAKYHKYMMHATAKPMTVAIYDIGFKPVEGLAKVLEKSNDIKGKLASMPEASAHFDFFIEALNFVKSGGIKSAFDKALRNGWQLSTVAAAIAEYGIEKGKINETKSALETLAQLRFGYTTSVMRVDLEKINFLGLQNLSIAKDGMLKDIFKGADWAINKSIMGAYNLGNIGNNFLRRRGTIFRDGTDRTKKIMKNLNENSAEGKEEAKKERREYTLELLRLRAQPASPERDAAIAELLTHNQELRNRIKTWDDTNQNQMSELMAFWNFVNKQNNLNPLNSQKAVQKSFDAKKIDMFNAYKARHDFAA